MKEQPLKSWISWSLALLVATLSTSLAFAQTTTVRFGSVGGATDAGVYIADELGYFKEAGLAIEMQRMGNAPSLTTAIATNQLDVAGISITPGLYTAIQQSLNLRIVGDKQSIRPGFSATRVVVKPELVKGTEAETIKGLKGKKFAISARAAAVYMLLQRLLAKHGMTLNDVQIVELAYPNMLAAMASGAVDAALNLEPFLSQTVQAGVGKVVHDLIELVPDRNATIVPLVYSENFAKTPAAQRFMTAYMKGVRVYNDAFGANRDKERIIEVIAKRGKIDAKVIREGFTAGLDPNQGVNIAALEAFQKFFVEQNMIRTPVDVNRIVDTSFAKAAIQALGPYQ
jgi:NitT/TauT family transport system substrate-binding protein